MTRSGTGFFSLSTITAGFVAVLIGFSSSAAIVYSAAQAAGADPVQISSWFMALCFGCAVSSLGFSLYYRIPVLTAWSTPGAALLATSITDQTMPQLIGAFIFSSLLTFALGASGLLQRVLQRIPIAVAAALLCGVLFQFGLNVFLSIQTDPWLAGSMFAVYLVTKRLWPRFAIMIVLVMATLLALFLGELNFQNTGFALTTPQWTTPSFDINALFSIGLPLFIVTLASQHLPGLAVLKANNYPAPASVLVGGTGGLSALLAPFGGFAVNLAAITAAICAGPESHPDPSRRYQASVWAGIFYFICALFAGSLVALLDAFPTAMIMTLAGVALFSTLSSGQYAAMSEPYQRQAALVQLLVTVSGVQFFGIGAPFWGLCAGIVVLLVNRKSV